VSPAKAPSELGVITAEVNELRDELGFPNSKAANPSRFCHMFRKRIECAVPHKKFNPLCVIKHPLLNKEPPGSAATFNAIGTDPEGSQYA